MQPRSPVSRCIRSRLRMVLVEKVFTWLGLALGICVPYFALQQLALFPVRSMPETSIDRFVEFDPRWIHAYLSIALLVPLAPLLAGSRTDLKRYALGLLGLCLSCYVVFLLFPVAGPRPGDASHATGLYAAIVGIDRPTNSMPSLHAGLALYSVLYIQRMVGELLPVGGQRAVTLAGMLWVSVILYSTLATAQHWFLDLPAGLAVAYAADRYAWASTRRRGITAHTRADR